MGPTTIFQKAVRDYIYQGLVFFLVLVGFSACINHHNEHPRERLSLNNQWQFYQYPTAAEADSLIYDVRPDLTG
ncbi:MAG: hypothetical protein JXR22_07150, partial [Prolixibacteraceae bacterium]|nr:hypothetical protein [Prolixibacteraceae bacterium]